MDDSFMASITDCNIHNLSKLINSERPGDRLYKFCGSDAPSSSVRLFRPPAHREDAGDGVIAAMLAPFSIGDIAAETVAFLDGHVVAADE